MTTINPTLNIPQSQFLQLTVGRLFSNVTMNSSLLEGVGINGLWSALGGETNLGGGEIAMPSQAGPSGSKWRFKFGSTVAVLSSTFTLTVVFQTAFPTGQAGFTAINGDWGASTARGITLTRVVGSATDQSQFTVGVTGGNGLTVGTSVRLLWQAWGY